MHELSVVLEAVKTIEAWSKEHEVDRIEGLVLQIGEMSSVVPKYVEDCYPAATEGTILAGTKLRIEIMRANARCKNCNKVFHVPTHRAICPSCGGKEVELLGGREFNIKEISVVEE
jgi:hydrogenase nickel incorporation protein HypA/HybF